MAGSTTESSAALRSVPELPLDESAATVLAQRCAASGGRPFLTLLAAEGGEQVSSYPQVFARAQQWRALFVARGMAPGDRVVIVLRHSLDLHAAFLGAMLGGFVPAMFAFPTPKFSAKAYFDTVGQLLESAQPRLLVVYDELAPELEPWVGRVASLAACVRPHEIDALAPLQEAPVVASPDSTAFLQFSSGTTGLRKGVAISHRALLWQAREYARAIALRADDIVVSWLPLYHDMGLVACFLIPFLTGTPVVSMSAFDWVKRPAMLLQALSRHRGTLCWLPNFAYNFMARTVPAADLAGVDLSQVRGWVNCSEPVMAQSHQQFLERFSGLGLRAESLAVSYAMAENTFAVTSGGFGSPPRTDHVDARVFATERRAVAVQPGSAGARALVSSGRALQDTEISIVDAHGQSLPERHLGEIVVRSPCMLAEYFRNPQQTSQALRGGRLFTGDVGYLADGELYVTGREKDMIILGGHNVFPQDIEDIVNSIPGVLPGRCVALGLSAEGTGTESLVVIAETDHQDAADRDRLCRAIADEIAARTEVVAGDVRLVPHMWLHKSSSGKIARRENLRRYQELVAQPANAAAAGAGAKPAGALEQVMSTLRRVLDQRLSNRGRQFGPDEALISSGIIDSFALVELLLELERDFGVRIPDSWADVEHLDTAVRIVETLSRIDTRSATVIEVPQSRDDILLTAERVIPAEPADTLATWWHRRALRRRGVRVGANLQVRGSPILRLGSTPQNLQLGNEVTLMPNVDLKLRGRGRIVIGNGVQLDTGVRIVAANDATVTIGDNARIGKDTIINAGADVTIGRGCLLGTACAINSSEHLYEGRDPVGSQGFVHAPILIGEDVWLGANVFVELGSRIGRGAVVGVRSVVLGDVAAFAVAMGTPARVVKMRSAGKP